METHEILKSRIISTASGGFFGLIQRSKNQGLYSFLNAARDTKNLNPINLACLSGVPPGQTGRPDRLAPLRQYWVLDGF
ncbi:MAG: hypothetical protein KDC54_15705 [Lewinella sp.]|nr:hypothetical protein [Lewinella sp.]